MYILHMRYYNESIARGMQIHGAIARFELSADIARYIKSTREQGRMESCNNFYQQ